MIIGTGIDIVEISRIHRAVDRHGERFLERVFTTGELEYCLARRYPERHLAARFAVKEAALKALGTGVSRGIFWRDVETSRHPSGRPVVEFHNIAAETLHALGATSTYVSISHTDHHAVALVILETSS